MRHVTPPLLPSEVLVGRLPLGEEVRVEAQQGSHQHRYHRRPQPQRRTHETATTVYRQDQQINNIDRTSGCEVTGVWGAWWWGGGGVEMGGEGRVGRGGRGG